MPWPILTSTAPTGSSERRPGRKGKVNEMTRWKWLLMAMALALAMGLAGCSQFGVSALTGGRTHVQKEARTEAPKTATTKSMRIRITAPAQGHRRITIGPEPDAPPAENRSSSPPSTAAADVAADATETLPPTYAWWDWARLFPRPAQPAHQRKETK